MEKDLRNFHWMNEVLLFSDEFLGNRYSILMIPGPWQYELVEAWESEGRIIISSNYQSVFGRTTYAEETAGGYYAGRLAVLEFLTSMNRQSTVIILRHITPEYSLPVGVWQLRESVRAALKKKPLIFPDKKSAVDYIRLRLPAGCIEKSLLLKQSQEQKTLAEF